MGSGSSNQITSGNLNGVTSISATNDANVSTQFHANNSKKAKLTGLNLNGNSVPSANSMDNENPAKKSKNVTSTLSIESLSRHTTPVTSFAKGSNSNSSITKDDSPVSINELQGKIQKLEQELAKSESEKLDLQDQIQMLEEKCKALENNVLSPIDQHSESIYETLQLKDQYITKLEKDLQNANENSAKLQTKMKKQMRILRKQIQELRQEASIKKMETSLDALYNSDFMNPKHSESTHATIDGEVASNHSKVIVELSNQMTEQSEIIAKLEAQVADKDSQIKTLNELLKPASSSTNNKHVPSNNASSLINSNNKLTKSSESISVGNNLSKNNVQLKSEPNAYDVQKDYSYDKTKSLEERPTTSLSDSDSDWDAGKSPSEKRIQSAMSASNGDKPELTAKPASAGLSTEYRGKFRKKTALQRRVIEKETNPRYAFTPDEQRSDSLPPIDATKKIGLPKHRVTSIDNEMLLLNLKL